jgi:ferredoxin--NADP+ reductase
MHQILKAEQLNSLHTLFEIEAPLIAKRAKPGQFIMVRISEKSERIPLTIAQQNGARGTITIISQKVGKTTAEFASLTQADAISDIIGPLGKPTDFGTVGKIVVIGGGVGVAEILPVVAYAKHQGNDVSVIIGARTRELIILEDALRTFTERLVVTTDDGSYGRKGLVTLPLKELLEAESFDLVYCVGPDSMMRAVCVLTKEYDLKTLVSLDANMVDATGMCGTCRVLVGGETKFTCVDGPEFDGHLVDWDGFLKRQKRFADKEKLSLDRYERHRCKCQEKAT